MLNIVCPKCQREMKLTKYKAGKFGPTCKGCNTKFQLLIKQKKDQSFVFKAALFPQADTGNTAKPVAADVTRADPAQTQAKKASEKKAEESKAKPKENNTASVGETALDAASDSMAAVPGNSSLAKPAQTKADIPGVVDSGTRSDSKTAGVGGTRAEAGRSGGQVGAAAIGGTMGPYRLTRLLGQGGMGAVYLAKQTSLDRDVALKVIKTKFSNRASMIARFTREAYAAAQLVHPNVVQIYDMGDVKGNCYFSMELVPGTSLSDVVQNGKKVDPQQAASFILHAARGLECAHNAGMVHRDIKPANLLVGSDGVVKVADLGLVKVPDQEEIEDEQDIAEMSALSASKDLTRYGSAIGTPYYMAPEQARNAVTVDHRADIYSLGCTFYVLLTGKKPFDGKSFQEVVSKHSSAPLVVPSKVVARVPESLSSVVAKMMAKDPDDRYQDTRSLIEDLEEFLGIASTEAFTPDEADAELLEKNAAAFNSIGTAKLRGVLPLALAMGSLLIAVLLLFVSWRWAIGFVVLPVAAIFSYFLISGIKENSNLFSKAREISNHGGILSWLKWAAAALLLGIASLLVGLLMPVLLLGLVGAGLGAAYYFLIDKPIAKQRAAAIKETEVLLRKMRLKGMEEATVQMFAAKYSGKNWEEFFESLFGYEAKRRVRDELAKTDIGKKRPKFWAWRDRISDSFDSRLEPLETQREKDHLQKIEQAGLQAEGVSASEAKERAAQMAEALVDHGDSIRVQALQAQLNELDPQKQRLKQRMKVKAMLAEARSGQYRKEQTAMEKITPALNRTFGSYTRFLAGCLLIVGCLMWARQNEFFADIQATVAEAKNLIDKADEIDPALAQAKAKQEGERLALVANKETAPLKIPLVGKLFFFNFNALIAGLILAMSMLIFGWKMSLFAFPAALITLWGGAFGIPDFEGINSIHSLSALIGVGLFMAGVLFGRMED